MGIMRFVAFLWLCALIPGVGSASQQLRAPRMQLSAAENTFRIIQLTDLHFISRASPRWQKSLDFIQRMLDLERPHLVVMTGDVISGTSLSFPNMQMDDVQQIWDSLADLMHARGQPWVTTFGNHLGDIDRLELNAYDASFRLSFTQSTHVDGEFQPSAIDLYEAWYPADTVRPPHAMRAARIYVLDTGDLDCQGRGGWSCINQAQEEWFAKASTATTVSRQGVPLPSLAFFHIPHQAYLELWNTKTVAGNKFSEVACSPDAGEIHRLFLRQGGMQGVFVGHDHYNDFCGTLDGILLCYGLKSGYEDDYRTDTVTSVDWMGVRGIELELHRTEGAAFPSVSLTTWRRLHNGSRIANGPVSRSRLSARQDFCDLEPRYWRYLYWALLVVCCALLAVVPFWCRRQRGWFLAGLVLVCAALYIGSPLLLQHHMQHLDPQWTLLGAVGVLALPFCRRRHRRLAVLLATLGALLILGGFLLAQHNSAEEVGQQAAAVFHRWCIDNLMLPEYQMHTPTSNPCTPMAGAQPDHTCLRAGQAFSALSPDGVLTVQCPAMPTATDCFSNSTEVVTGVVGQAGYYTARVQADCVIAECNGARRGHHRSQRNASLEARALHALQERNRTAQDKLNVIVLHLGRVPPAAFVQQMPRLVRALHRVSQAEGSHVELVTHRQYIAEDRPAPGDAECAGVCRDGDSDRRCARGDAQIRDESGGGARAYPFGPVWAHASRNGYVTFHTGTFRPSPRRRPRRRRSMADVAVGLPFSPAGTCHTGSIQWDHPLTAADSLMATYRNLPAFVLGNLAHSQGLQGAVVHWLKVAHSEGLLEGTVVLLVGDPGPPKQPTFLHWLLPRRRLPPAVVAAL